jgi:hypothetical protein
MPRRTLPCLCFLAAAVVSAPSHADDVRRCVDAQGNAVYTDRPCEAVQAMPRDAPPDAAAGAHFIGGFAVRGCARRPEQLLDGVRGALEARDVNRLANWYHWTGTGSGTAKYLMDQLEAIAKQPLVAIELMYPGGLPVDDPVGENGVGFSSPQPPSNEGSSGGLNLTPFSRAPADPTRPAATPRDPGPAPAAPTADAGTTSPSGPATSPPANPGPRPEGLRVQQVADTAAITPVSTEFRLVRNAGCWWIEL